MIIFRKYIFSFLIIVFGLNFFNLNLVQASTQINKPLISSVKLVKIKNQENLLIKGSTYPGTEVLVYINNKYKGTAKINQTKSGLNNFYYYWNILTNISQNYKIMVVSRDKTSLVLSPPSNEYYFKLHTPAAPTLISPNSKTITAKVKPLIIGLTQNNTLVHLYIDGLYNGTTKQKYDISGTAHFSYKPFLNLNRGNHKVWAIAEDEFGNKSKISNILSFQIKQALPAPILYQPIIKNKNKPLIIGLAKNNFKINIFIDHKLNGSFKVNNNLSGTANFVYHPFLPLTPGEHLIYATAIDNFGKESVWSNLIFYKITALNKPQIGKKAASVKAEEKINKIIKPAQNKKVATSSFQKINKEKEKIKTHIPIKEDINKVLKEKLATSVPETGILNESKENQGKLKLNLIIFILFLVAIIAWIFWVNRELIKEKQK